MRNQISVKWLLVICTYTKERPSNQTIFSRKLMSTPKEYTFNFHSLREKIPIAFSKIMRTM